GQVLDNIRWRRVFLLGDALVGQVNLLPSGDSSQDTTQSGVVQRLQVWRARFDTYAHAQAGGQAAALGDGGWGVAGRPCGHNIRPYVAQWSVVGLNPR